nr:unnamed protein product [Spirometra erinaceieuropaei]
MLRSSNAPTRLVYKRPLTTTPATPSKPKHAPKSKTNPTAVSVTQKPEPDDYIPTVCSVGSQALSDVAHLPQKHTAFPLKLFVLNATSLLKKMPWLQILVSGPDDVTKNPQLLGAETTDRPYRSDGVRGLRSVWPVSPGTIFLANSDSCSSALLLGPAPTS